jgi:wobble nucleotide-excising tRNase
MNNNLKKIILGVVGLIIVAIAARYSYYGSLDRSCVYTEEEKTVAPRFKTAKIRLFKQAVVISGPTEEYACLPLINQFTNRIQEVQYARNEKGDKTLIDEKSNLEFEIIKYISVTKHGITTMDSGKGPIDYLILKDQLGKFYRVAIVSLGINRDSDEYLKATTSEGDEVLSPETAFLE